MKKLPAPPGRRIVSGLLAVTFTLVAVYSVNEAITGSSSRFSKKLGTAFNEGILGASKLGMDFSGFLAKPWCREVGAPSGVTAAESDVVFGTEAPRGVLGKNDDSSFIEKKGRALYKASHRAFITASRVAHHSN